MVLICSTSADSYLEGELLKFGLGSVNSKGDGNKDTVFITCRHTPSSNTIGYMTAF